MLDESGSISGPDFKLGPEYKKLIDDYIAEEKDRMAKRIRCSYCLQIVKIGIVLGEEVLERHVHDPHGASGGQHCIGSGQKVEKVNKINSQWAAIKKAKKSVGSELEMPKNIAEDHKAFRDIITGSEPVKMKLKEKIKNGSIFHSPQRHFTVRNPEPILCSVCGENAMNNMDCFYGECMGKPKSKYKPLKCSVEIIED